MKTISFNVKLSGSRENRNICFVEKRLHDIMKPKDWSKHGTFQKGPFAETQFEASFVSRLLLRADVFKKSFRNHLELKKDLRNPQ